MSKRRRKPGRLFWLWTFAVGVYSPRKGQRRIAADRANNRQRIAELEARVSSLEASEKLLVKRNARMVAQRNDLQARLEIADGVSEMDKVKTAADKASATVPLRIPPSWAATDSGVLTTPSRKGEEDVSGCTPKAS